jgi:trimeric autotransporter adhesin
MAGEGYPHWVSVPTLTQLNFSLSNLSPGTTYEVRVQAVCRGVRNLANFSPVLTFTTRDGCTEPTNVRLTAVTSSSGTVTWDRVLFATAYEVFWGLETDNALFVDTTTTNTLTIPNLDPATNYKVTVRALCTNNRVSGFSDTVVFRTLLFCARPAVLEVSAPAVDVYNVRWRSVPDAFAYEIRYRPIDSLTAPWSVRSTVDTTLRLFASEDVSFGTQYRISVQAICAKGGDVAPSDTTRSFFDVGICQVPRPNIVQATASTATIRWAANPAIRRYFIEYRLIGEVRWTSVPVADENAITLTGLVPNRRYEIRLMADCGSGALVPSNDTPVFTTQVGCLPPVNVIATPNVTFADISWPAVATARSYEVWWRAIGTISDWSKLGTTSTSLRITPLISATIYEVRVVSVCPEGQSEPSRFLEFRTLDGNNCERPRNVRIEAFSNRARVSWDAVPGAMNYTIEYRPRTTLARFTTVTTTSTSTELVGLIPNTAYVLRLFARCNLNPSPNAEELFFTLATRDGEDAPVAASAISVYPNPNKGQFTVQFSEQLGGTYALRLMDLSGKEVWYNSYTVQPMTEQLPIDVGHLPAGVYLLQVAIEGRLMTTKLMIE